MVDYEFMDNKEWYDFDYTLKMFVLKEGAPERAKKSYQEYLEDREFLKQHPEITF